MNGETNQFGIWEVANRELKIEQVPAAGDGFLDGFLRFALSYDGYTHHPEKCADMANQADELFRSTGALPPSLTELRACLFFEQRRWRNTGEEFDAETLACVHALCEAIRGKVLAGDLV